MVEFIYGTCGAKAARLIIEHLDFPGEIFAKKLAGLVELLAELWVLRMGYSSSARL